MKSDHASRQAHASEFWRAAPNAEEFHYLALHTDAPVKSQRENEAVGLAGYARLKVARAPGGGWKLGPREVSNLFDVTWDRLEAVGETIIVRFLSIGRRDGRVVHVLPLREPRTFDPGQCWRLVFKHGDITIGDASSDECPAALATEHERASAGARVVKVT